MKNKYEAHRSCGMTLVELMIGSIVVGILALVLTSIVGGMHRQFWKSEALAITARDSRDALRIMTQDIGLAQGPTVTLGQATGEAPLSRISFTTLSGVPVSYWRQGRELKYSRGAKSGTLINNLDSLFFTMKEGVIINGVDVHLRVRAGKGPAAQTTSSGNSTYLRFGTPIIPMGG